MEKKVILDEKVVSNGKKVAFVSTLIGLGFFILLIPIKFILNINKDLLMTLESFAFLDLASLVLFIIIGIIVFILAVKRHKKLIDYSYGLVYLFLSIVSILAFIAMCNLLDNLIQIIPILFYIIVLSVIFTSLIVLSKKYNCKEFIFRNNKKKQADQEIDAMKKNEE